MLCVKNCGSNKSEAWLKDLLKKEQVDASDIFYAFYKNNKAFIIKKDDVRTN